MKTIKLFYAGAIAVGLIALNSCSKDEAKLPPINGYNNSNEVAKSNLIAHWTFDGTTNEAVSGTAPTTTVGNSFTTGTKGQALALTNGYLVYPSINALNTANAFPDVTVSLWVKIANNGTSQTNVFGITQSKDVQTDWNTGPLNVYVETGNNKVGSDTLQLHANFATYIDNTRYNGDNVNNYGVRGTDFQTVTDGGKWMHYVMRYDGTGSLIDLFADGVRVSNNNFRHRTRDVNGTATGLGPIVVTPPTQVVVGAWPNATSGFANSAAQTWQGLMTGDVDEIRVYNKALSDSDIGSLYQLEKAGR
jgi:hypothetical protein